jgi:hypothetical protein
MRGKQEIFPKELPLTVPISPALTKPKEKPIPVEEIKITKANPVPDLSKKFIPKIEHRTLPLPEFELPGDVIHQRQQKVIEELKERNEKELKEKRNFHAHPLNIVDKVFAY